MRFQRYANRAILIPNNSNIVEIIRRDCYYLRRITHLNNLCALNCRPMQLASCFIPRTNSLKCVVQLCRNGFFLCDIRVRAFIRFLSFFFLFLFHFSSPPPPPPPSPHATSVPGQIVKRNLDVCGRFFFFLVGKSTRFRFLKRVNRRLNRCSRLGADERTIVWSRIGDGVLFDSFILDRAPRVIRFFFREVSERRSRIYGRDFFFFFFFPSVRILKTT